MSALDALHTGLNDLESLAETIGQKYSAAFDEFHK
jgi:hypothetical protein